MIFWDFPTKSSLLVFNFWEAENGPSLSSIAMAENARWRRATSGAWAPAVLGVADETTTPGPVTATSASRATTNFTTGAIDRPVRDA